MEPSPIRRGCRWRCALDRVEPQRPAWAESCLLLRVGDDGASGLFFCAARMPRCGRFMAASAPLHREVFVLAGASCHLVDEGA